MSPRSMRLASETSSLGGEQRHLADLAQVHAHGVVARRLDGEVELGRLLDFVRIRRDFLHDASLFGDLDAQVGEEEQQLLDLRGRDLDVAQSVGHVGAAEAAQLVPFFDEPVDFRALDEGGSESVGVVGRSGYAHAPSPAVGPASQARGTSTAGGGRRAAPCTRGGRRGRRV